jgi:predicted kinase
MERAAARAVARRDAYRASGAWTAAPVDLVADALAAYPDRVALVDAHAAWMEPQSTLTAEIKPGKNVIDFALEK